MDISKLQADLRRVRRQMLVLLAIGKLMRMSLRLDEVVFLILSAVTSREGLGFNRAILFLFNADRTALCGSFGVGPARPEEATVLWHNIEESKIHLDNCLEIYRKAGGKIDEELNQKVRAILLPLSAAGGTLVSVLKDNAPLALTTSSSRAALQDAALDRLGIDCFAAVPVRGKDQPLGVLLVDNVTTQKEILKEDIRNLVLLTDHAGLAIENALAFGRVLEESQKDSLTQLWNHAHFQKLLHSGIQRAKMERETLTLALVDLDDFKQYNDRLGHQQGDRALKRVAEHLGRLLRKTDYLARYGGEEFAVIFPGTEKAEAYRILQRSLGELSEISRGSERDSFVIPVSFSAGIAACPHDTEEREKLIYCADVALYQAKRLGKNQIASFG